ncbi:hypothetical protein BJ742DRAFT_796674 [Cladochytrium replicatum]|nr:hypothetical protein BJ742DRAFT_796674 [Cladochytrium replicatum]
MKSWGSLTSCSFCKRRRYFCSLLSIVIVSSEDEVSVTFVDFPFNAVNFGACMLMMVPDEIADILIFLFEMLIVADLASWKRYSIECQNVLRTELRIIRYLPATHRTEPSRQAKGFEVSRNEHFQKFLGLWLFCVSLPKQLGLVCIIQLCETNSLRL